MNLAMLDRVSVPYSNFDRFALDLYRKAVTVFYIEERMKVFAKQGKCSFVASSRGHIITQTGLASLLRPGHDWFFTYYRSKGTAVGVGLPVRDIFLGMLGRDGDPNSGARNMPEHFSSKALNYVSMTACTGSQYLAAVGAAKAIKQDSSDAIVYVESGEGATSEGEFFEALNWASRESLPVLLTVQNNGFAISTRQKMQTGSSVRRIAEGFGVHAVEIDGTSAHAVHEHGCAAIDILRRGEGPVLIEAKVVRLEPHSSSDDHRKYRTQEELIEVAEADPIVRLERELVAAGLLTNSQLIDLRQQIKAEVDSAADGVDHQPEPPLGDLLADIFSSKSEPVEPGTQPISAEPVTFIDAINHGLREELARNPKMVMWGEDIDDPKGGVFGVTRGLGSAFPGRVTNAPLAKPALRVSPAGWQLQDTSPSSKCSLAITSGPRPCSFGTRSQPFAGVARERGPARLWCE